MNDTTFFAVPPFPTTLGAALFSVQQELFRMGGVEKDSTNPHFGNSYVDRNGVLDAVLPLLNKAGVMVLQVPQPTGMADTMGLQTLFVHVETGEKYESLAVIPLQKSDPQGYGSAITYASRYALVVALGLKTLDDDDGEAGSGRNTTPIRKPAGGFPKPAGRVEAKPEEKAAPPVRRKVGVFPTVAKKSVDTTDQSGDDNEQGE